MQNYKIEIKEISAKIVSVKAPSEIEALDRVKKQYRSGDIVLEYDSFVDVEFSVFESGKEDTHG
ncbi:DpnD/PcfM family protein [Flexistipes sp.]|uniref:DpnD/PcfM family protein n=1 Tax=Flexistipes sp. TaxID=3088135 RepID=UPI002E1F22FE|nr:DpnD/PcfM family protein [Flexistipes sp.]